MFFSDQKQESFTLEDDNLCYEKNLTPDCELLCQNKKLKPLCSLETLDKCVCEELSQNTDSKGTGKIKVIKLGRSKENTVDIYGQNIQKNASNILSSSNIEKASVQKITTTNGSEGEIVPNKDNAGTTQKETSSKKELQPHPDIPTSTLVDKNITIQPFPKEINDKGNTKQDAPKPSTDEENNANAKIVAEKYINVNTSSAPLKLDTAKDKNVIDSNGNFDATKINDEKITSGDKQSLKITTTITEDNKAVPQKDTVSNNDKKEKEEYATENRQINEDEGSIKSSGYKNQAEISKTTKEIKTEPKDANGKSHDPDNELIKVFDEVKGVNAPQLLAEMPSEDEFVKPEADLDLYLTNQRILLTGVLIYLFLCVGFLYVRSYRKKNYVRLPLIHHNDDTNSEL